MILSGTVSVQTHPENDMTTVTVIGSLSRGDTTGEIETLTGCRRVATVVCKKEAEVIGSQFSTLTKGGHANKHFLTTIFMTWYFTS